MSKRRTSKQQNARMEKHQLARLKLHDSEIATTSRKGLVLIRFAKHAEIEDEQGNKFRCSIKPHLRSLVCGDRVLFEPEGNREGMILSIYPRTSLLERMHGKEKKPVAANITQLVITIAPKPEISWSLLDSYLVVAENLGLHPLIVLNKTDLPCEIAKQHLLQYYAPQGYQVLHTQKTNPESYENLRHALKNEVSIFVGQSGTGKSSLISALLPHEENIVTAAIATQTELGKHTTSNSRYYHLPSGGALIDSPGVRAFSISDMEATDIAQGYREFRKYISDCKFRNCNHLDSPGCAIIKAVEDGNISALRYNNFLELRSPS